jgi:starch phosphorylase
VGRCDLLLLDSNVEGNAPEDRDLTSRLYGGDGRVRIRQELLLGVGGFRALKAMGITPGVLHLNEGHSGFAVLEAIRSRMEEEGVDFHQAVPRVSREVAFTTHTPVPAGHDRFDGGLIEEHLGPLRDVLGLSHESLMGLGRENTGNPHEQFCMTVLGLRIARRANAVSALHGEVSRAMWTGLFPGKTEDSVPIGHITNGVHVPTWLAPQMFRLYDRHLGTGWHEHSGESRIWEGIENVDDGELWETHLSLKARLLEFVRRAAVEQAERREESPEIRRRLSRILSPDVLTIGFARRFATYKRANLILADMEKLASMVNDPNRPVQFVFAGKAHPADHEGKELIKAIINFARDPAIRRRFVFIENYDIGVARQLVQGVDVWLNTPRRPYEASGTSGMKAAANGVLNCSILDGWWVEGYELDHSVGWAIGRGEQYSDANYQDALESQSLYNILEKQIIPLFYQRSVDNIPRDWIGRMKTCMTKLAPMFNTNRMVKEYAERFYIPAFGRGATLAQDNLKRAVELAHYKQALRSRWPSIRVVGVHTSGNGHYKVGDEMQVEALVDLPEIDPRDLSVQLYAGPISGTGQIENPQVLTLQHSRQMAPGRHLFTGKIQCCTSGRQGFALRVLPGNPDMATPFEPGLIIWN